MSLELVKIQTTRCVFIDRRRHKIYTSPISKEAKIVLNWNRRHVPVNDL